MVWEWVAPVGTVLGASIGAFVGGRYSRGTQARQHAFEREAGVLARGHEKAGEAMVALELLQRGSPGQMNLVIMQVLAPDAHAAAFVNQLELACRATVHVEHGEGERHVALELSAHEAHALAHVAGPRR